MSSAAWAWVWYAYAIAALLTLGAVAGDGVARVMRRATRWVWVVVIVGSIVVPLAGLLRHAPVIGSASAALAVVPLGVSRWLLAGFLTAWAVTSLVMLLRFARALVLASGASRRWARALVDGVPVLIAPDDGPAVIGVWQPAIVLPAWALVLPRAQRGLVLLHELEHRRARDQWVGLAASLVQAAFPWNLPLWYQLRRLRLAIELDCDARVLRRRPDVARYGRLLVDCAARSRPTIATALSGPAGTLAYRIQAMTAPKMPVRTSLQRALTYGLGALVAVASVSQVRRPPPIALSEPWHLPQRVAPAVVTASGPLNEERVVAVDAAGSLTRVSGPPLRDGDAAALRSVRGPAVVRFIQDPDRPTQTVAVVTYRQE